MHSSAPPRSPWPFVALLVANLGLACGPWLVRLAESGAGVGPVGSAFWRLALAWPVLAIATRVSGETSPARSRTLLALAASGGAMFAADLAAWHSGILRTRLANATLLGNVTAVLFPAYGFVTARRLPSRLQATALALAAGGAFLLVGRSYQLSSRNIAGDLFCIGAGLCYTAYLIAVERARRQLGPLMTLTLAVTAGAPLLLAFALWLGEPVWPHRWTALILLAGGSQLIGQGLILYAVGQVDPLLVGVMLLVQPIVAAIIGWSVYGEALTCADGIGATAIGLAVLLVRAPADRLHAGAGDLGSDSGGWNRLGIHKGRRF